MNESEVLLSIVIPAYNSGPWIVEAMESTLRQNIAGAWELIVVNDGSKDDTLHVVETWSKERDFANCTFICHDFPTNRGVSAARNQGMELAKGEWIMFMDADDILLDGALGSMLEYLSFKSEIDLVFSPSILTKEPQVKDFQGINFEPKDFRGRELYSFYRPHPALSATVDVCLSMLFSRHFLKTSEIEFTEGMSFLEDGAFIAKSFSIAKKSLLQWNPFYQLRVHPSSTTQQMKIYDYQALEGHFKGIASLKEFSLKHYGVENDAFLQGLIIKYSLLPYQSCIDTRGLDLKKHRWVHGKMKDLGFYPIQTNSGNAYLVMLARWLNISVYYYYFRWWFRLLGIAFMSKFKKK